VPVHRTVAAPRLAGVLVAVLSPSAEDVHPVRISLPETAKIR
jgi:hypothetical protein